MNVGDAIITGLLAAAIGLTGCDGGKPAPGHSAGPHNH